jgi:hypothetical protein
MRIVTAAIFAAALSFTATAQDVKSPACDLLTMDEATTAFGEPANSAGATAETMGTSGCGYIGSVKYGSIALSLSKGEAFGGGTADQSYEAMHGGMSGMGTFEDLPGLGEKAAVMTVTGAPDTYMVIVLKNSAVLTVNTSGVGKDAIVAASTIAAGRM